MCPQVRCRVLHLMQGVRVGGMEKGVLQQITLARRGGAADELLLFDTPAGDADADYDTGDIPVAFLPRGPGLDPGFVLALRRHLAQVRPRVVHAHNDTALCYAALALMGWGAGKPCLVGTFHNHPPAPTPRGVRLTRWASGRAQAISCVSDELRLRLRQAGWFRHAVVVVNGIDADQFLPTGPVMPLRARLGLAPGALLVGHIGRFDDNKRQQDLVQAVRLARAQGLDLGLVMVGQGPRQADILRLLQDDAAMDVLGRVADPAAFLRALDLFVLCSAHEGLSRALMEAMACARATLASDVGGNTALLADDGAGACGLLVPAGDPQALAAGLASLAGSARHRRQLGNAARLRVAARHSAMATAQAYERLMAAAGADLSA